MSYEITSHQICGFQFFFSEQIKYLYFIVALNIEQISGALNIRSALVHRTEEI